jgi:hypothetical protein
LPRAQALARLERPVSVTSTATPFQDGADVVTGQPPRLCRAWWRSRERAAQAMPRPMMPAPSTATF